MLKGDRAEVNAAKGEGLRMVSGSDKSFLRKEKGGAEAPPLLNTIRIYFSYGYLNEGSNVRSRTQIFRKLIGSLLSPCACSLIGALSYGL